MISPNTDLSDTAAPGLGNRFENNNNNNKRRSQEGPRRAGAQRAGPGAAEVAPPRPGTLAPGAEGMTDSATANGDDRDPEIELFVKVGWHPGARCTCRSSSRAPCGAGSRASADRAGTLDSPQGGHLGPRAPLGVLPASGTASLRGSGMSGSQAQSGRWPPVFLLARSLSNQLQGQWISPDPCPVRFWGVLKGILRYKGVADAWLDH